MASGPTRTRWVLRLLAQHRVDVVGIQEFQSPQAREFQRVGGGTYAMYPARPSDVDTQNAIAWRRDTWRLVTTRDYTYRYFHGSRRHAPVVLLENVHTHQRIWFTNHHNPADTWFAAHQQHWRNLTKAIEIRETRRLLASGYPLIMTGDMNERATFFCPITNGTGLHASNGGSHSGGRCRPPADAWIDWILGSSSVHFTDYQRIRNRLIGRTSDHPMILNQVRVDPTSSKGQ